MIYISARRQKVCPLCFLQEYTWMVLLDIQHIEQQFEQKMGFLSVRRVNYSDKSETTVS